jgi:exportin-2 (importin alpha re-exporter)
LNGSKTEILAQRFVRFFYFLAGKEETGPDFVVQAIDAVQVGIFGELYTAVVLPDTLKLNRATDRKIAVAGLTKLVGFSEGLATTYHKAWPNTVMALLKILEVELVIPKDDPLADLQTAEIDDVSFGASFVRLNTCKKRTVDIFPEVLDSRVYVGGKLKEANTKTGGRVDGWISGELSEEVRTLVRKYMQG